MRHTAEIDDIILRHNLIHCKLNKAREEATRRPDVAIKHLIETVEDLQRGSGFMKIAEREYRAARSASSQ